MPLAIALVGIVASGSAAWYLKPSPAIPVTKFPIDLAATPPVLDAIAVSPDGRRIVYEAEDRLYLRDLDQMTSIQIPGTEQGFSPFFSPDGTRLAFTTATQLKAVDLRGGPPVVLAALDAPILQGLWHESGRLFFGQAGPFGLSSVAESGGALTPFAALGKSLDLDYPDALPGGEWILFTDQTSLNWNDASIVAQSIKTGERKVLLKGGFYARYVRTGHLVYARGGNLYAVRFDVKNLATVGNPVLMVEHVLMVGFIAGQAQFALGGNGTLIYRPGTFGQSDLALVNERGDVKHLNLPSQSYVNPQVSPDGPQIAVQTFDDSGNDRIWRNPSRRIRNCASWPGTREVRSGHGTGSESPSTRHATASVVCTGKKPMEPARQTASSRRVTTSPGCRSPGHPTGACCLSAWEPPLAVSRPTHPARTRSRNCCRTQTGPREAVHFPRTANGSRTTARRVPARRPSPFTSSRFRHRRRISRLAGITGLSELASRHE